MVSSSGFRRSQCYGSSYSHVVAYSRGDTVGGKGGEEEEVVLGSGQGTQTTCTHTESLCVTAD